MPIHCERATGDAARRRRRRSNNLLLVLAVGFLAFGAAAVLLYYALQPVTLRIAVGPPGSADHKVIEATAGLFAGDSRTVRLSLIQTNSAVEALALLGGGKVDLAVGRSDLEMPADAQTVAIVRKNFVVVWTHTGLADKSSKGRPASKIQEITDLAGHRVGVIGLTPANGELLRVILRASGVEPDNVSETQFGTDQIEELARDALSMYLWRWVPSIANSPRMPSPRLLGREEDPSFLQSPRRKPSP